jgi:hypothetical protein
MALHSPASKCHDVIEVSTSRRGHHLRLGLGAVVVSSVIALFGAPDRERLSDGSASSCLDHAPA